MRILCVDTSTQRALLILLENGVPIKTLFLAGDRTLSSSLHKDFASFLGPKDLSSLSGILVGLGPGAFTGTRIGLVFAKTLAYAKKIPIQGFCSLELPLQKEDEIALLDAKSQGIYVYEKRQLILYRAKKPWPWGANTPFCSLEPAPILKKLPHLTIRNATPNIIRVYTEYGKLPPFSLAQSAHLRAIYLDSCK
ncbi:MAG: tRNA (adenosine(37)-N6)-threonylcarbamoyltransferase complex dimerization subunit type 1 TsaB [Chlamydiota bacterium]